MTKSTTESSLSNPLTKWLETYLQVHKTKADEPAPNHKKPVIQELYQLPLGPLKVLTITAIPAESDTKAAINATRSAAIKFALKWMRKLVAQDKQQQTASLYILVLDIKAPASSENSLSAGSADNSITHSFGAQYAIEHLATNTDESGAVLQAFSGQDWQRVVATVQTPNELWRLLQYHKAALQSPFVDRKLSFDCEQTLLTQFMKSAAIYSQALSIDNALIKYGIQEAPNSTLVAMSLAQKHEQQTTAVFYEQMRQAAILWGQLSTQMHADSSIESTLWQRQLLEESLFSRHELIRTLYQHPNRSTEQQQAGYVVHQHSYETLGRHYVMIFYGQQQEGKQSRQAIAPNLATIAKDVATRLPMAELHHVIVLGIELLIEDSDTFIDIDLFIQPVTAMSDRERQLTKQLQRLHSQQQATQKNTTTKHKAAKNKSSEALPKIQLSLNIPAAKKQP